MRGLCHSLRLGRRGCCSMRVKILYLTGIPITISMGWLRSILHVYQIGTYEDTPFYCFLDNYTTRKILSHTLTPLIYNWLATNKIWPWNQQACYHCSPINTIHTIASSEENKRTVKTGQKILRSYFLHWMPDPFTKDLDTLTLNESRTEHIRKGHQRPDHP